MAVNLKQGFRSYLLTLSSISAGIFGDRIWPNQAEQNPTFPFLTFYVQDDEKPVHLLGASALARDTITLNIYAQTPESRTACLELLRNALHGRINIDFPQDTGTLDVRSIKMMGFSESFEDPTDGSQQGSFVAQVDFLVVWGEPVPTLPTS